jgi:geranylgeranyl diphosphate synthase type II
MKDMETQLAAYRALLTPLLHDVIPDAGPRKHLYDPIRAILLREGKGLRPALCLATCRAFGGNIADALPTAAALELLHNAFLVHDDLEDASDFRRGQPTLHREYGAPLAINIGDALNALSARLLKQNLTRLDSVLCARVFEEFDHLTIESLEGQAMELGWIRDNDCSICEDDYLQMVLKKTSWYSFIHPMRLGAMIARPEQADLDVFNVFGCHLGLAFQIQDDLLNLVGSQAKYGKEIGGDLLEGKRTLMLIHLLQYGDAHEKLKLAAFLAKPRERRLPREVAWIYGLLEKYGSLNYARAAARGFAAEARRLFDAAYAEALPGPDLEFIRCMLDYLTAREA